MPLIDSSVHFGDYEVDLDTAELRRNGAKVKLQDQPFQILVTLLEQPGKVVSRETIRRKLWPTDVYVDYERGLNTAMKKLREALEDEADKPRYIETLPRHGYRFIAEVERPGERSKRSYRPRVWFVCSIAAAALMAIGIVYYIRHGRVEALIAHENPSIAVLPLVNLSGDPQQEYFADGMTESLITDLGRLTGLRRVIARRSVMQYKQTQKPLSAVANELNVDLVITGAVLRSGDRVRVTTQLTEPKTGIQLWTENYERQMSDILKLQAELTASIAAEIRVKMSAVDQQRLHSAPTVNPEAYDAYLMGRFYASKFSRKGYDRAMEYFQLAAKKDSNYAPAYAGIGLVWSLRSHLALIPSAEGWGKSRTYATRALDLDQNLAEAHQTLGAVYAWYDWNWQAADQEFRRAIELDSGSAYIHNFYSMFLFALRRLPEAKAQVERALELDPYEASFHTTLGWELMHEGRLDEALEHFRKAKNLEPENMYTRGNLIRALERQNLLEEAWAETKEIQDVMFPTEVTKAMDTAYGQGGYWKAKRAQADTLAAMYPRSGIRPFMIAQFYAILGKDELAITWLEKAYQEHSSMMPYINVLHVFDSLRSNPRFQEIEASMNFPIS